MVVYHGHRKQAENQFSPQLCVWAPRLELLSAALYRLTGVTVTMSQTEHFLLFSSSATLLDPSDNERDRLTVGGAGLLRATQFPLRLELQSLWRLAHALNSGPHFSLLFPTLLHTSWDHLSNI